MHVKALHPAESAAHAHHTHHHAAKHAVCRDICHRVVHRRSGFLVAKIVFFRRIVPRGAKKIRRRRPADFRSGGSGYASVSFCPPFCPAGNYRLRSMSSIPSRVAAPRRMILQKRRMPSRFVWLSRSSRIVPSSCSAKPLASISRSSSPSSRQRSRSSVSSRIQNSRCSS